MAENIALETIRKPQIIEATIRKISDVGFSNVTMEDIAREAGLSKGGIAHYFSSKESLFKEAFRAFFDRIFQRGRETMDRFDDPLDKLLSFVWLYDRDDPDLYTGYPLHFDCMALAARDREYRGIFHEWVDNWIALLSEALEQGVSSGKYIIDDIEAGSPPRLLFPPPEENEGDPETDTRPEDARDMAPRFSPDGRHIAFTSNRSGNWEVYILNIESGDLYQVTIDTFPDIQIDIVGDWSVGG